MLDLFLREHVGGLVQIFCKVHPVVGRGPARVGYGDLKTGKWSLIATHGFSESHIDEVDRWFQEQVQSDVNAG